MPLLCSATIPLFQPATVTLLQPATISLLRSAKVTASNNATTPNSVTTPTPTHFETVTTSAGWIEQGRIFYLRQKSCFRCNLCAKLNQEIFDEQTRKRSNVAGKLGKLKLNPVLVDYIKSLAFQHFPLEQNKSEKAEWGQCVIAIDELNRQVIKPKRVALDQV